MTKPKNPPAFPQSSHVSQTFESGMQTSMSNTGMTLRDYFAGQAVNNLTHAQIVNYAIDANEIARRAYSIADAMLMERQSYHQQENNNNGNNED